MARGGHNKIDREALKRGLLTLAEEIGQTPTRSQMNNRGPYSGSAYRCEFGSWNEALESVGLSKNRPSDPETAIRECPNCGSKNLCLVSKVCDQERVFCDIECKSEWQESNYMGSGNPAYNSETVQCEWCETTFKRRQSVVRDNNFCGRECYGRWRAKHYTGENSSLWAGGSDLTTCE